MSNQVSHPDHYTHGPKCRGCGRVIECIDVVISLPYAVGNVIKYLWRMDYKGKKLEDLLKARQYLDFLIEQEENA